MKNVILIGTEEDIIFELRRAGYLIKGYFGKQKKHYLKFLGPVNKIENYIKKIPKTKICIAMGPAQRRKKLLKKYKKNILTYVSNASLISPSAKILTGSFVQSFCFLGNYCEIGECCKINVRSNIHHNSVVGSFTDIAPNSTVLGNSKIGKECYLGAGSIIREKILVTDNVMTGINSAVVKDINKPGTYVGVPAKKIKKFYIRP
jgi:sugar O-acyltransferase (sialic acid O-acetyltransferase NeuD family)